jgi:hypothetical protein
MTVIEAKHIAIDWVAQEGTNIPGFNGAFLHGSSIWMQDNAHFPASSDIDVLVVSNSKEIAHFGKVHHKNVVLDVCPATIHAVQKPEDILKDYHLSGSIRNGTIISDPTGRLYDLQAAVTEQYANPYWVNKRCENARHKVIQYLETSVTASLVHEEVTSWLFARGVMAHIILVAGLQNPTIRKRYVETKKILAKFEFLDFYEKLLELSSFNRITKRKALYYWRTLTEVYDTACSVSRSPYRFAGDISTFTRPIAIGGTKELIDSKLHREAMFWIVATYCRCGHIIYLDGSFRTQRRFSALFNQLLDELDILSAERREQRNKEVRNLLPETWKIAESIIAMNSAIPHNF